CSIEMLRPVTVSTRIVAAVPPVDVEGVSTRIPIDAPALEVVWALPPHDSALVGAFVGDEWDRRHGLGVAQQACIDFGCPPRHPKAFEGVAPREFDLHFLTGRKPR